MRKKENEAIAKQTKVIHEGSDLLDNSNVENIELIGTNVVEVVDILQPVEPESDKGGVSARGESEAEEHRLEVV